VYSSIIYILNNVCSCFSPQLSYPDICSLNVEHIVQLHAAIQKCSIRPDLPYQSLPLLLEWAHDCASTGWDVNKLEQVVRQMLYGIRIVNKVVYVPSISTTPEILDGHKNLEPAMTSLRQALCEIKDYQVAQGQDSADCIGDLIDFIDTELGHG